MDTFKRNLGGDRIGSGAKMQVDLKTYNRSTHDLSYIWRSTAAPGTLIPFMKYVGLPGDTFDIELDADVKTHPTIGPLFGSYKLQLDVYFAPIRLYQALLHNNLIDIGLNMNTILLPKIILSAYYDAEYKTAPETLSNSLSTSQINPSCIFAYLGIRGVGLPQDLNVSKTVSRAFNAVPLLAYWDIFKNYYANKQETNCYMINTNYNPPNPNVIEIKYNSLTENTIPQWPNQDSIPLQPPYYLFTIETSGNTEPELDNIYIKTDSLGWRPLSEITTNLIFNPNQDRWETTYDAQRFGQTNAIAWRYRKPTETLMTEPSLLSFPLSNFDEIRKEILSHNETSQFYLNAIDSILPISYLTQSTSLLGSQQGLMLKTYQSDIFNNWLKTANINAISTMTSIDTSGGSFTIDSLILSRKIYDLLNRVAVAGGTYYDWLETVYTTNGLNLTEIPVYMGGLSKEIAFQEVVATSESTGPDGTRPLGSLAGKGILTNKHKGGKILVKPQEIGYIMGIVSITPRIDYSQGNDFDVSLDSLNDFHKPELDQIGFQDMIQEHMAWWTTQEGNGWEYKSQGKQPAWIHYMTDYNKCYGNFAIENQQMFMTLNRRYEYDLVTGNTATIKDATTYIDPRKYNHIFAQTSLDAQNFWVQIAVKTTARRLMSAKIIPTL